MKEFQGAERATVFAFNNAWLDFVTCPSRVGCKSAARRVLEMEAYVAPTVFKLVAVRKPEPSLAHSLGQLDPGIECEKYAGRRLFVSIPARGHLLVPAFERADKVCDIAAQAGIIASLSVFEVDHQQRGAVEKVLIRHLIGTGAQGGGIEICLPCALKIVSRLGSEDS